MSQQAQNDYYEREARARARLRRRGQRGDPRPVRRRRRHRPDRRAVHAGAPREGARATACEALPRALDGVAGTTAVHICFGYAAIIHERPDGLLVPDRAGEPARATRSRSRPRSRASTLAVLDALPRQDDHPRRDRPRRPRRSRRPRRWPSAYARALPHKGVGELIAAPDCGMKYLPRDVGVRQAAGAGGRRGAGARRRERRRLSARWPRAGLPRGRVQRRAALTASPRGRNPRRAWSRRPDGSVLDCGARSPTIQHPSGSSAAPRSSAAAQDDGSRSRRRSLLPR